MNNFLALYFVGIAFLQLSSARIVRDVSLGYKYNPGSNTGYNFLRAPETTITTSNSYSPTGSSTSYFNTAPSFGASSGNGFSTGFGSDTSSFTSGSGFSSTTASQVNYNQQAYHGQVHHAPIVTKHFYIHSAPEDHDEQQIVRYINVGRPQKNYNVVFIKAPTSSVSRAKIIANVQPVEDKTAIYVLAKKSNALDVTAEVVTPQPIHHKPDVFFIKYKTPAEAEHAQHVIQTQYDSLGGTSQVTNEGVVPVSSVIGSLGGNSDTSANVGTISTSTGVDESNIGVGGGISVTQEDTGAPGCCGFNTDQGIGIGNSINVVNTGDNTQQTYLPAQQK